MFWSSLASLIALPHLHELYMQTRLRHRKLQLSKSHAVLKNIALKGEKRTKTSVAETLNLQSYIHLLQINIVTAERILIFFLPPPYWNARHFSQVYQQESTTEEGHARQTQHFMHPCQRVAALRIYKWQQPCLQKQQTFNNSAHLDCTQTHPQEIWSGRTLIYFFSPHSSVHRGYVCKVPS